MSTSSDQNPKPPPTSNLPLDEEDYDDDVPSSDDEDFGNEIFTPRTENTRAAIQTFWSDFEGKDSTTAPSMRNRKHHIPLHEPETAATSSDKLDADIEPITTSKDARKGLEDFFGLHYDYIEASLGLIAWLLLLAFLYQYSAYAGYKYHYLIHEMSGLLILTFTVPFCVVMLLWYMDIRRDEKIKIDEIREKKKIISDIKKATKRAKKK
ncbi:hypothetical protein TrVE_jg734 [Triparma verrucosa]|uniref:Uncharacterized protein n=1 Tax=Triparma verrucosa TaxID=1606542 RepID=A0A9W7EQ78_9STRA|nr:hypothetical protein TrVE_jg734 [Triparma verrucosa]